MTQDVKNIFAMNWQAMLSILAILLAVGAIATIDLPDDEYSWSGARWRVGQTKHGATLIGTEKGGFFGMDYAVFDFWTVKEESVFLLPDGMTIIVSIVNAEGGYIVYTVKEW